MPEAHFSWIFFVYFTFNCNHYITRYFQCQNVVQTPTYHKLPKIVTLVTFGISILWGLLLSGDITIGGFLLLGIKYCYVKLVLMSSFYRIKDLNSHSSLNLSCCQKGGQPLQRSAGKLVRYCKLSLLHDALLCQSAVTISQCNGQVFSSNLTDIPVNMFLLLQKILQVLF